jgi:hypothetical protein
MALTWANFWGISAQEFWGREFSVMASEKGAVECYDNIAGADSIWGTAIIDGPDGRAVCTDACAGWDGKAIKGWEGGHRGDWCEPSSQGKLEECLIFVLFLCRKKNNTPKPSTAQAGWFLSLFQTGERHDGRIPPAVCWG